MKPLKSNRVKDWNKKDIQTWLSLNGLSEYYIDFVECGITDGSLLKNKLDGISSEQDLQIWVSKFVFAFGHLRKLMVAINHLKDNEFVFNIESINFESERQKNDKLSGKSSSFVSKATVVDSNLIRNRDVRSLTVHEVVSLIRNDSRIVKLKDENLGIGAWSKEHEETFLFHKIDGQIFINITKPSDYADFVFDKLRPNYSDSLRAQLFETLTGISQEIYGNGYRYVDPVDRSSTTISDLVSQSGQSSDSSYPILTHQDQLGVIIGKIRQSSKKVQTMSDDDLKEYAENLCTIEGLKKAYLNKEFNAIKKLFSSMKNISQESKGFSLNSKSESKSFIGMTDTASLDKLPSDIEEAEELSKKLATRFRDTIKVKLVIAEIAKNKKERTMRRLLSPIMSSVSMSPQFGLFHSGVILGPWLIEWNSSSLCIPRRCYSNAATLAIDIQEISTKNLDVAIEKVSQIISEWNVHHEYSQHSSNCQHFVDDICKALGIKMNFTGSMLHYVEKLRNKGLCNIRWRVPDEIRELVGIKEKKVTFYTHKQLDILVCTILSKIPNFQEKYEEDYMLLKSFDRAFWLRSFKSPQNANYHAITPEENRKYSGLKNEDDDDMGVFGDIDEDDGGDGIGDGTGCPFGHPESRSFTADWW